MPEQHDDGLVAVFAAFRADELPRIRPAGLAPVRIRARQRRAVRVAGACLLAIAVVAVLVPALSRWQLLGAPTAFGPGAGATTAHYVAPCRHSDIVVQLTGNSATVGEPWVVVSFINTYAEPCELIGYPALVKLWGVQDGASQNGSQALAIEVVHGPVYGRSDPGEVPVVLPAQGAASFALGTEPNLADAFAVDRIQVSLPGTQDSFDIGLSTPIRASSSRGQPVTVTVTALAVGKNGLPQ